MGIGYGLVWGFSAGVHRSWLPLYSLGNYCFIYYAEMDYPLQCPGMQFLLVLLFCAVNIFSFCPTIRAANFPKHLCRHRRRSRWKIFAWKNSVATEAYGCICVPHPHRIVYLIQWLLYRLKGKISSMETSCARYWIKQK